MQKLFNLYSSLFILQRCLLEKGVHYLEVFIFQFIYITTVYAETQYKGIVQFIFQFIYITTYSIKASFKSHCIIYILVYLYYNYRDILDDIAEATFIFQFIYITTYCNTIYFSIFSVIYILVYLYYNFLFLFLKFLPYNYLYSSLFILQPWLFGSVL